MAVGRDHHLFADQPNPPVPLAREWSRYALAYTPASRYSNRLAMRALPAEGQNGHQGGARLQRATTGRLKACPTSSLISAGRLRKLFNRNSPRIPALSPAQDRPRALNPSSVLPAIVHVILLHPRS